jgi:predicted nucleotidyltransferase
MPAAAIHTLLTRKQVGMQQFNPTPYPELNMVLGRLVAGVRAALGASFSAAYLQGSFAVGDFDEDSDVDFLIAVEDELSAAELAGLQALHGAIYDLATPWTQHLEGSYVPRRELRRAAPARRRFWFLNNTARQLELSDHDDSQVVRWVVRERGISLAGPPPQDLIDPVDPADLRREVLATMRDWAAQIFADPTRINNRWYQPYAVLSYCRMLQTLHTGTVESKPAGAAWAARSLGERWAGLIGRAWAERPDPSFKVRQPADPADLAATLEFIEYALAVGAGGAPG